MKKISIIGRGFMIALTLMVLITMMVSAAPSGAATTKALSTNYTLVNLGSQDASVTVQYFKENGATWAADSGNSSFSVSGNFGQKTVAQYFDTTMQSGRGSAVVSSSAPLGGVVQILARNQTPSSGAYSAITNPSGTYYLPLVQARKVTSSGTSNAQIMIQNTDTANPQTVTVDFIPSKNPDGSLNGNAWSNPGITIPAGSTNYYDLSLETNLVDNWSGAAVVNAQSNMKVAVVVSLFAGPNTLTTYNAFPIEGIGLNWAIPQFVSRLDSNHLSTSVNVQNLGTDLAIDSLVMDCTATSGFTPPNFQIKNTTVVSHNQSYSFNPVADTSIPGNWSGACSISSPQNVVVIVTLRRPSYSDDASAYEAFNKDQSTNTKVVFPLMSKRQANGFATNGIVQNLGNGTATVRLTYTAAPDYTGGGTPAPFTATIALGGNLSQNLRYNDVPQVPNGWHGTLLVESIAQDGNQVQPLVGYVQLTNIYTLPGDTAMAHDAFTLP